MAGKKAAKTGAGETGRCHAGGRKGEPQERKPRHDGWTEERRQIFFDTLAATSNVTASARAAGIAKISAYRKRDRDAKFRADWMKALAAGFDHLELEVLRRQRFGTPRPVIRGGVKVAMERRYTDAVALRLLAAHRDAVTRVREAEAAAANELELARLRLREKLGEMRRRMGGAE